MKPRITRRDFCRTASATVAAASTFSNPPLWGNQTTVDKVTLAFVGCAHIHTPGFVELLKGRKDVNVKLVWDHDPSRSDKRAHELGSRTAKNIDEVWADREITGVVICSETIRHYELVLAAAKARKHMFVEKPLGIGSRESYEMAEVIERANLLFTTGYFNRTIPQHLFIKEQIEKGNLGQITRVFGSNCHNGSLEGWFDTEWRWMADPKQSGVGAFGDLGTHLLDILMWLVGGIKSVTADIKVVTKRYGDCDESGEALIKFTNGVTGTLAGGWVDVANPVTLLVSGTGGYAMMLNDELFYQSKKVDGADGKKPWTKLPPAPPAPMHMFVDAVKGNRGLPLVPPREAATRVSVMEAMYQASRDRKWVDPA
jgi:predicted dehydrogenase